ncbi:MAG: COX15/CtaA family protein [Anaerolineae bacterium]|nr:COX15/CtaA family protein [Anaerolineae bacterium]
MRARSFTRYAWLVVGYNVLVILWGAVVRATGSGAGCGSHWPTCNGEILHRPERVETLIELTHRLSSGLAGLLVLGLLVWALRAPLSRFTRRMAALSFIFILIEGALGAGLVLLELVADNASAGRAAAVGLHLANTFVLLAFLALTAWSSGTGRRVILRGQGARILLLLGIALLGTALLSAAGAVTALGDTLFPAESLAEGLQQDFDPTASFLIRLRIIHPALAILTSLFLLYAGQAFMAAAPRARRPVLILYAIIAVQVVGGFINVALLAPVWMQVVHLLLADALWLALVISGAETLGEPAPLATPPPP